MRTNAKIYVMRAEDGTLKLGHSVDPARRSKEVGRVVEIVHETDIIEHVERIERAAHRVLALHGKHLRGEWFEATLDDAINAIEIATRQAERQELELGGKLKTVKQTGGRSTGQLNIRVDSEIMDAIDEIRASQRPIPTVSQVIRSVILTERDRIRRA